MGYAVGTSLVAVTAFGLTTAFTDAASGLVDWPLAAIFILGGLAGGYAGIETSAHLAGARVRSRRSSVSSWSAWASTSSGAACRR